VVGLAAEPGCGAVHPDQRAALVEHDSGAAPDRERVVLHLACFMREAM
jgi:hypothetical protein